MNESYRNTCFGNMYIDTLALINEFILNMNPTYKNIFISLYYNDTLYSLKKYHEYYNTWNENTMSTQKNEHNNNIQRHSNRQEL